MPRLPGVNYYNENDPNAAAWLRELIANRLLPYGDVDDRSIVDVEPSDLNGYTQCHFFAGIGGWPEALRLAGWSSSLPVWTGSCPCQPFSVIGKRKGETDERHLWPEFRRLIEACKPPVIFGEQVASKAGRVWLSGVFADLEELAYRRAGADLCAAGVGAPHIRQRLFWVADTFEPRLEGHSRHGGIRDESGRVEAIEARPIGEGCGSGGLSDWGGLETVLCTDGKERRVESESFPLAHGFPERVGLLRGYGNAVVPRLAAEFITAYVETL